MTYDQLKKKVSGLIRLYRNSKGYTQEELGEKTGLSQQDIQNYESAIHLPQLHPMSKIVEILEIPGNEIFGEGYEKINLQELSKTYAKYNKYIKELAKDKKLRKTIRNYIKVKQKRKK